MSKRAISKNPPRITEINNHDVLLGRGGKNNQHSGNEMLRQFARQHASRYFEAQKKEKTAITREIVRMMYQLCPRSRFLKKVDDKHWEEVDESTAREKVSQVLRDAIAVLETEAKIPKMSSPVPTSFLSSRDDNRYQAYGSDQSSYAKATTDIEDNPYISQYYERSVASPITSGHYHHFYPQYYTPQHHSHSPPIHSYNHRQPVYPNYAQYVPVSHYSEIEPQHYARKRSRYDEPRLDDPRYVSSKKGDYDYLASSHLWHYDTAYRHPLTTTPSYSNDLPIQSYQRHNTEAYFTDSLAISTKPTPISSDLSPIKRVTSIGHQPISESATVHEDIENAIDLDLLRDALVTSPVQPDQCGDGSDNDSHTLK